MQQVNRRLESKQIHRSKLQHKRGWVKMQVRRIKISSRSITHAALRSKWFWTITVLLFKIQISRQTKTKINSEKSTRQRREVKQRTQARQHNSINSNRSNSSSTSKAMRYQVHPKETALQTKIIKRENEIEITNQRTVAATIQTRWWSTHLGSASMTWTRSAAAIISFHQMTTTFTKTILWTERSKASSAGHRLL